MSDDLYEGGDLGILTDEGAAACKMGGHPEFVTGDLVKGDPDVIEDMLLAEFCLRPTIEQAKGTAKTLPST